MNQQDETSSKPGGEIEAVDETQANANDDAADQSKSDQSEPAKSGSGGWLAALGLIIALLAGAGVIYLLLVEGAGERRRLADIQSGLDTRGRAIERLSADVKSIADETRQLEAQLNMLGKQTLTTSEDLASRVQRLEGTVASISGIAADVRYAWLKSEAEYFLRIANAQLNLAGNVDAAAKALELADEILLALADPRLTTVRAQLSDERAALGSVPRPDTEGIVLQLGSLARSIESLPLAREAPDQFGNRRSADISESGFERAWRVILDALKNIISVKRDDEVTPLMSQADESMLIRSLDLELQIARLALIRNDARTFEQSLQAAKDRLERYFDTGAPGVAAALATLNELQATRLPDALPDISGSLALLLRIGNGS